MNSLRNRMLRALCGIALSAMTLSVVAQDFPMLQGTPGRTGQNSGALLTGPGRGFLTWYRPIRDDAYGRTLIRDDQSTETTALGAWPAPALNEEAFGPYFPVPATPTTDPVNAGENALRGILPAGAPGYRYTTTIPSAAGNDPRIRNFPADNLNTFTWTVEPPVGAFPNQRFPRNYALYVWLPQGPTNIGGVLRFPSRYWVYEIEYGNGDVALDVVDTFAGGGGWVRLGGGGFPTNRLFPYDGTNPIRIRLYNTLPRRPGRQSDNVTNPLTYPWLNTYFDVPYTTIVYADAVRAEPTSGNFQATPLVSRTEPGNNATPIHAFSARNNQTVGVNNGQQVTVTRGEVTAHDLNTGVPIWTWSPIDISTATSVYDNLNAGVTATPPWAIEPAPTAPYQGTNYLTAPIELTAGLEQAVTYTPTLAPGSYQVQVWMPGSRGTENLGRAVQYLVNEGATQTVVTVDQDAGGGWITLGTGRWNSSVANPLSIQVTNLSTNPADAGRVAFADAIRFIGNANLAITSTPIVASAQMRTVPAGATAATGVIVTAAEDGRLYCLRSAGNGTGGTDVFWAYPSLRTPDPNQVATEDGVGPVAQMPTGFDLSSAVIANIGGQDYLYIGSRNGRIYCFEMAGRGDQDFANGTPGTTRRVWTYPDDFPAAAQVSRLGPFRGSLTYAVTANGPTIFAPTSQGRIYALDALPGLANKTTTVQWTFPPRTSPTLGAVLATPTAANGRLFFGTQVKAGDDRGRFYALDWNNGVISWQFNGTTAWDVPAGATFIPADDFISGAAYADVNVVAPGSPEMIFVANENRWITAFNATNGTILWTTNELATGVRANLSLSTMDVFTGGGAGATNFAPLVMVPTTDGRFVGLFANSGVGFGSTNRFGTKRAWQFSAAGDPIIASMSVGHSWMFGADSLGFLYGFNNLGNGLGGDVDGPGGGQDIIENDDSDANVEAFRDARIVFVTRDTYERLRLPDGDANHLDYASAVNDPTRIVARPSFDWGETLYALVFDFPYQDTYLQPPLVGSPAPPPVVNFQWSVEGAYVRNVSTQTRRFRAGSSPALKDGYGLGAFVLQGAGSTMLPPGSARVTFSITSSALNNPPRPVNIQPNPTNATRLFAIANPLGIRFTGGGIGLTDDPSNPENQFNGSQDVPTTLANESLLTAELGVGGHGQSSSVGFFVLDRSLMVLLRGEGQGLDNVRFSRSDMQRQGGKPWVAKAIDSIPFFAALYGSGLGLEDYPGEFPNPSSDYPDIPRERVRATKDPLGSAENPLFNAISLNPPINLNMAAPVYPTRTIVDTPFELTLDVPRFMPPVVNAAGQQFSVPNSAGAQTPGGYYAPGNIFVDTDGDGLLTRESGRREAFRNFWIAGGVAIDERMAFGIESIDFGSLAHSSGLDPAGGAFSPYAGPFTDMFKPFILRNEGNVNMLNVRMAKFYNDGVVRPWEIYSSQNDAASWLNGSIYMTSSLDPGISGMPSNVMQKSRVGDLNPSEYRDNPYARANPYIGVAGSPILAGPNPENPMVGVRTPLGFPVGAYRWIIRAFEDAPLVTAQTTAVDVDGNSVSSFDDLDIRFLSRESRVTNSRTPRTGPMIDDLVGGAENHLHNNVQPTAVRDFTGSMVAAFASDRFSATVGTGFDKAQPTAAIQEPQYRIYVSGLQGGTPTSAGSPLSDLDVWANGGTRWFNRTVADYPSTAPATLFPGDPVIANSVNYLIPTFPTHSFRNPLMAGSWTDTYMGFVGNFLRQVGAERVPESRLMLAQVQPNNGSPTVGNPIVLDVDPQMRKGRMSLIQVGNVVTIIYTAGGTGQSVLHYVTYDGSTTNPQVRPIDTGAAFDSVGVPSAVLREYRGVQTPGTPAPGNTIIDLLFQGKLRGRENTEIFFGRMTARANGIPNNLVFLQEIFRERLVAQPDEPGMYRSQGVRWNTGGNLVLEYDPGTGPVAVETGTRQVDRQTGIITVETRLGRALINPAMGTVRLASPIANRGGALLLTYQPRFLRVSGTGDSYSASQMQFDDRLISDTSYWATAAGAPLPGNDATTRHDRMVVAYGRAASGSPAQAARPYMQTLRFGVQLPEAINTDANGNVAALTVTGATGPWQADPSNGRVYFSAADENRQVTIQVNALAATPYRVGLITEKAETQIAIEQAVNESQPWLSLDPFGTSSNGRRPPLMWLFYTSTRAGAPDIFFQTLSPKLTPVARN